MQPAKQPQNALPETQSPPLVRPYRPHLYQTSSHALSPDSGLAMDPAADEHRRHPWPGKWKTAPYLPPALPDLERQPPDPPPPQHLY
ncbi:hypothetical protein V6N13_134601 [Hibiscus sabdariffa]